MESLKKFGNFIKKHQTIGLDSILFIYQFEKHPSYWPKTLKLFEDLEKGKFEGVTSIISLLEILTKPKKENNFYLVKFYSELIFTFPNLRVTDIDYRVADLASSLRAEYNIKTPDSLHLASALAVEATGFITSDKRIKKIKELDIFYL